jgi:hypothetical protein
LFGRRQQGFCDGLQTVVAADGSKQSTCIGTAIYTGCTGKYLGIRPVERTRIILDLE